MCRMRQRLHDAEPDAAALPQVSPISVLEDGQMIEAVSAMIVAVLMVWACVTCAFERPRTRVRLLYLIAALFFAFLGVTVLWNLKP